MSENGKSGNVLAGLVVASVVGAVVGAGVALLFAPQSGRESRDWLARRTGELKDRIAVALEASKDAVKNGVIPS